MVEDTSTPKPRPFGRGAASLVGVALLLIALTLGACSSAPSEDVATVGGMCSPKSSQSTLSVLLPALSSDWSGREREAWVYRPDTPDTEILPVLYMLHGLPGMPEDFLPKSVM